MNRVSTGGEGANFKFRVALADVDADNTPLGNGNFQIHEKMRPVASDYIGSVTVPASGTAQVNIGQGYDRAPVQILVNDETGIMGGYIFAEYDISTGIVTFTNNDNQTRSADFAVLFDY